MIKRLQWRLILVSMISLTVVLTVMIILLNVVNTRRILQEADQTLSIIRENKGIYPVFPDRYQGRSRQWEGHSPESPFDTRYCSIRLDTQGNLTASRMDRIASLDQETALKYAQDIVDSGRTQGTLHSLRYLHYEESEEDVVLFLYFARQERQIKNLLVSSLSAGGIILAAVFLMLLLLSGRMVRPLAESYEKQRRFITDAGHELRTPLTIIDADTELLMMDNEGNEWLQDIRKQTARLSELTNDLIYLSRMEEERQIQMLEFPLSDVCTEAAASFQGPALARGLTLDTRIAPMVSYTGDERDIARLISVLLDNAVKYASDKGTIRFSMARAGKMVEIVCANDAAAMSPQTLKAMFDRFSRGDPARNAQQGGFGIGLSMAAAIVQAHKGKITASQQGHELVITVQLPVS